MKKICIIMSVILMLLVVGCAPPGLPPEPTPPGESDTLVGQAFRPGMVIAGDYSPPWDLATGEMEFTTTPEGFSDSTTDISLDVDVRSDDYIYYQGYYYNSRAGGWEAYELDGTRYIVDGAATNWIVHSAGATIPFTGPFDMLVSGENYILMYSCEWDAGWHCGPRTLGDTEPHWTIQSFTVCGAGEVVDGASCVAVSGAITEVCDNGADDDHDSRLDCADADCAGDAACAPACDLGVDSDCDGAPDCVAPGCSFEVYCDDGADDDDDSWIDCEDPDCSGMLRCPSFPACADSDADGYGRLGGRACPSPGVDCNDDDATVNPDAIDVCGDGIDQDCDGSDNVCLGIEVCYNALDDDGDTLVDCEDNDCSGDLGCAAAECYDSDRGPATLVTPGYVRPAGGSSAPVFDICRSGGISLIREQTCSGSGISPLDVTCDSVETPGFVCIPDPAGAYCGAPAAPPGGTCIDGDSANPEVGGETIEYDAAGVVTTSLDTCLDPAKLQEFSCSGASATSSDVICTSIDPLYVCITDPAGGGDYCGAPAAPPSSGPEVICNNGLDDDGDTLVDCRDNDCFADVACTPSCTESDLGDDPGTASYVVLFPSGTTEVDSCVDTRNLKEMICDAATGMTSSVHDCTIGSGSCETDPNGYGYCAPPIDYCNDNEDGGFKPEIPGHNLFRDATDPAGPQEGIVRDSCMSPTLLLEGTCSGTALVKDIFDCTSLDSAWKCQVTLSGDSLCGPTGLPGAMLPSARADFCIDPDGGDKPTIPSVLKYRGSGVEVNMVETCKDATTVMEYWCTAAGSPDGAARTCPAGTSCRDDPSGQAYCG